MRRSLVLLAVGGLAVTGVAGTASAGEEFVVTTVEDTVDATPGDGECEDAAGDCSLRAAVQEANALAGEQRIRLSSATYVLSRAGAGEDAASTGDLDVTGPLVVLGGGATVDAAGLDRVVDVLRGASLTASEVTLTDGAVARNQDGAVIRSFGALDLRDAAVTDGRGGRFGGGIASTGTLRAERVVVEGNTTQTAGGGIAASGSSQLTQVRLVGNTSVVGGGVVNAGTLDADGLEVVDNTAQLSGGGLSTEAGGTTTVDGSTFSGNVARGGRADNGGGAVANRGGTTTLTGTTLADNRAVDGAGSGGAVLSTDGDLTLTRVSASGNEAARAGGAVEIRTGDVVVADSSLTGNATGPRPGNGGALHVSLDATTTVTGTEVSGNTASSEGGGLWNSSTGTMEVVASQVTGNVANGEDADTGGGGLFNDGGTFTVRDTLVSDNSAPRGSGSGGGLLTVDGSVLIEGSQLSDNDAARAGGAVEVRAGDVTVRTSALNGNETGPRPGNGGAVHVSLDAMTRFEDVSVQGNTASSEGGGLWNSSTGSMTVRRAEITGNVANGEDADTGGGGLFNDGGTLTVRSSSLAGNSAPAGSGSGGGLLTVDGTVRLLDVAVEENSAARAGGGAEVVEGRVFVNRSTFTDNATGPRPGNGGALHVTGAARTQLNGVQATGNTATSEGGALWNSATGSMSVISSELRGNTAAGDEADNGGGGLFTDGGRLLVRDTLVVDNAATGAAGSGGGLLADGGRVEVQRSELRGNTAVRAGGGVETTAGARTTLVDVALVGNTVGSNPGNGGGLHQGGDGTTRVVRGEVTGNTAVEGGGLWNSAVGAMVVEGTSFSDNDPSDLYFDPPATGVFTVDGEPVPAGPSDA